jgi:hypothetical protein
MHGVDDGQDILGQVMDAQHVLAPLVVVTDRNVQLA